VYFVGTGESAGHARNSLDTVETVYSTRSSTSLNAPCYLDWITTGRCVQVSYMQQSVLAARQMHTEWGEGGMFTPGDNVAVVDQLI
jgi:hypothetical protein